LEKIFSIFLSAFRARKFSGVARDRAAEFRKKPEPPGARAGSKIAALLKLARVS